MANKKLKMSVDLDFTSDQMSIEKIREQIDTAVSAVKINLDPESAKKFEGELRELGGMLERHLNQNTGKINAKSLVADLDNNENFLMIEKLGQRYAEVGVNGQQSFRKVANEADFLNKKIGSSNQTLEKMGTTLMNTIRWNISSSVVNAVTGEFQKMYYFAKDLDRTLTDIRIVSGQSADQMERFALAANESAKALGVSTIEYGKAATLFFQQGLGEVDVRKMTDGAVMASRITGTAASDMADLLTSTMNGYKLAADEVMTVTDKLAAVGATTASNFEELSTGMSKVASMANTAGVTIDSLNAQLATIIAVTRESPESIGTSLKTIYGRMLMFKTDTKALMEDEDGEVFGAPKVEEALQAYSRVSGAQISLFKTTADGRRELRDLGEVIEEIGDSWDDVTDRTAKFGLATALAGSRQQNRLVALFDSWDMYKDAMETSLNAEGTTLRQNAIYLESYEGKVKGLQAAKEEMYMVLTDSDSMKFFVGALTEGVQLFTKLADMAGGFSAVLGIIGVAFSENLVKKAYEFQQAFTIPKEMKETGKDNEQIQSLRELQAISKVFGADEANRYREDLRNKKATLKEMKVESQLLIEKQTLLKDISEVAEMGDNEAKKKAIADSLIAEAAARGVAIESAEELRAKYNELAEAERNLKELEQLSYGEVIGDQIHRDVEAAQAVVDGIESQIDSIHEKATEAAVRGNKAFKEMEGQTGGTSAEISAKAKEAEKLMMFTQATRAAFMLLPAAIGGATDSSKSFGEVLKNIGMLTLPSIAVALKPVIASLVAAKGAAVGLNAAMFLPLAPIAAVAAAAAGLAFIIRKVKENSRDAADAFEDMSVAAQELSNVEEEYNKVADSLESIRDRIREIKLLQLGPLIEGQADELAEELEQLEIKKRLAEEEMVVQQFLLDTAKEKAELAAMEAAEATTKSKYLTKDGFLEDGSAGWHGSKVTIAEELNLSTIAFERNSEAIKDYKNDLAELRNETAETAEEKEDLAQREAQLLQTLREAEAVRDSARDNMSEYLSQVRENIASLDEQDEAQKALIDSQQGIVDKTLEVMALDMGYHYDETAGAVEEYGEKISDTKDELKDLNETYDEAISKMNSYGALLDELESAEGLSAKSKEDIISNYEHLIPYMHDEAALKEELMRLHEIEAEVAREAAVSKLISNEDFWNASIEGNTQLINALNEFYGVDLKNAKTLAEAKGEIEAQLIKQLTEAWGQYYGAVYKSVRDGHTTLYQEFEKLDRAGQSTPEALQALASVGAMVETTKNMANAIAGISIDLSGLNFSNIGRKQISPTKKSGSGGSGGSSRQPTTRETKPEYDYDRDLKALEDFLVKYIKKRGELEKKAIDDWYKKEIEALDKIHKAKIDAYEEDLQKYKDVADEKIRLLNDTYDEENYYEDLSKEKEEERRIQSQIDKLALDDSSRANDERRRLRELLAQQVEKIADMERSREKDLKVQAYRDAVAVKEDEVNDLIDKENELYEDSKAKIEATKDIRLEVWEKSYDDAAVYAEASKAISSGLVKDFNGKMVSVKSAYVDFENRYGKGMGILGDKTKKEFLSTIDRVNLGMKGLMKEAGYLGTSVSNSMNSGSNAAKNLNNNVKNVSSSLGGISSRAKTATSDVKKLNDALKNATVNNLKLNQQSVRANGANFYHNVYADGGKADFTGPAWLDGTPNEPEYVFNYPQFRDLAKYIAHERNRMPDVGTASTGGMGQGIKIGNLIEIKGDVTHDVLPLLEKEVDKGIVKLRNMIEKQVGSPSRI